MARWKDDRRNRARHEAAHAVVARKLGLAVPHVTVRKGHPHAQHELAAYLALNSDNATRIEALEKDAIVSQAGYAADVHDYPDPIEPPDLFDSDVGSGEGEDSDTHSTRSCIYKIICLRAGKPVPDSGEVRLDQAALQELYELYNSIVRKADDLVEQNWPAMVRVAKHLERHGDIDDQATLDSLIERAGGSFGRAHGCRVAGSRR